jgi:adenosylcobinamide-phosphate synthase
MTLSAATASALGLATGYLADLRLGDPRRGHPVAGFGRLATALERRTYADRRAAGAAYTVVLVGGAVLAGALLERGSGRGPARWLLTATATWTVLGGRSLGREAMIISGQLAEGDLSAARQQVRNLVGRDPAGLDAAGIARAVVESVAENTSDAVVAPLLWGAVAGVPGLLGYRAVNTLDAMIGHRSARYRRFGAATARLDDVANWVPARVAGLMTAALSSTVGGSAVESWQTARRDAGQHPSPNAGVVEAAFAGGLGVRLGGLNTYGGEVEDRGQLGRGRPVAPDDIARATRLAELVGLVSAGLAVALRLVPALPWKVVAHRSGARSGAAVFDHCGRDADRQ